MSDFNLLGPAVSVVVIKVQTNVVETAAHMKQCAQLKMTTFSSIRSRRESRAVAILFAMSAKVLAFSAFVASAAAFAPVGSPALRTGATSLSMAMDKTARAPVITVFDHRGCTKHKVGCWGPGESRVRKGEEGQQAYEGMGGVVGREGDRQPGCARAASVLL